MIEGLGKSRRDGGTLREKRRTGQGLRGVDTRSFGGQYKMWVLGRKLRLRLERRVLYWCWGWVSHKGHP